MVEKIESHNMTVFYLNLCYSEVCYKGTALLMQKPNGCNAPISLNQVLDTDQTCMVCLGQSELMTLFLFMVSFYFQGQHVV